MKLGQPSRSPDDLRRAVVRRLAQMVGVRCEPFHVTVETVAAGWYELELMFATQRAQRRTVEYLKHAPWATLVGPDPAITRIRLNHLDML